MIKEFIGTGKDVESATKAAVTGLNAPAAADVKIELIAMPTKKLFGLFGGSDAQVKASYDDGRTEKKPPKQKEEAPKKQAPKKQPPKKEAAKKPPVKKEANKKEPARKAQPEKEMAKADEINLDYAVTYLKAMIDGLKVKDAKITAEFKDGAVVMEIKCSDYGIIIGRRGDTLDSLQQLTSLALKRQTDKYVRVVINVGNYREKREETLRNLAKKNAAYVARTGRRFTFESMNPFERRVIHTTIQEIDGVESRSIGYDQDRRVLLEPTGGARYNEGSGGRRTGAPQRGAATSDPAPAAKAEPKAGRPTAPKFGKIEINKD